MGNEVSYLKTVVIQTYLLLSMKVSRAKPFELLPTIKETFELKQKKKSGIPIEATPMAAGDVLEGEEINIGVSKGKCSPLITCNAIIKRAVSLQM